MRLNKVIRLGCIATWCLALLALGACAGPQVRVDTPHPAPAALLGAQIQLQADPANAESAQADVLQLAVLQAMTTAGMRPLLGAPAAYQARYSFRVYVDLDAGAYARLWAPPGPPWFGPGGRWGWPGRPGSPFGPAWEVAQPWYLHVFELEIRDSASGALVWRSSSVSGSYDSRLTALAPALADSALQGFPQASGRRDLQLPGH